MEINEIKTKKTREKLNEIKSWFIEKINKIDKLLARLTKKNRWLKQNYKRDTITDTTQIQRILRDYNEQLHTKKLNNLEEMDKFLETYNLPRLNHEKQKIWKDWLLVRRLNHQSEISQQRNF